jgi:hypothetical protein
MTKLFFSVFVLLTLLSDYFLPVSNLPIIKIGIIFVSCIIYFSQFIDLSNNAKKWHVILYAIFLCGLFWSLASASVEAALGSFKAFVYQVISFLSFNYILKRYGLEIFISPVTIIFALFVAIGCTSFLFYQSLDIKYKIDTMRLIWIGDTLHYNFLFGFVNEQGWFRRPSSYFSESSYAAIYLCVFLLIFHVKSPRKILLSTTLVLGIISTGSLSSILTLCFLVLIWLMITYNLTLLPIIITVFFMFDMIVPFIFGNEGGVFARLLSNRSDSVSTKLSWITENEIFGQGFIYRTQDLAKTHTGWFADTLYTFGAIFSIIIFSLLVFRFVQVLVRNLRLENAIGMFIIISGVFHVSYYSNFFIWSLVFLFYSGKSQLDEENDRYS